MIKITDRFYINANSNCYVLQEKTKVQDENSKNYGQEIFKDLGYYSTLESCLKSFLKINIREFIGKDCENSIKDLLKEIQNINNYLKEQFKI